MGATLLSGIGIFLVITLLLVIVLLVAKHFLVSSGKVTVTINDDRKVSVESGRPLLSALATENVFLPSACGGKGSCGQCKVRVTEGGGEILPTEAVHFTRKEIKDNWRLACQVKVKGDLDIKVPAEVLDIKEYECTVVSNNNVATFIKEFIVALPEGEHMNFIPGSYAQINYPAEGDRFMLTVRIATPPFKPKPEVGFMDVNPGIASSYIFTLKPGDKVLMSGPYGDFHPIFDTKNEMMWIGGGAGMAPLRAQIMHMTKTLKTTDRKMNYFYGARALNEVFYLDDFLQLEKEFPNFKFHLALDRPDPTADAAGVKYTPGFVHQVIYDTYLKDHESPEDIEYYMCGPGPMSKAVNGMLDSLGVDPANIHYDNFGG